MSGYLFMIIWYTFQEFLVKIHLLRSQLQCILKLYTVIKYTITFYFSNYAWKTI